MERAAQHAPEPAPKAPVREPAAEPAPREVEAERPPTTRDRLAASFGGATTTRSRIVERAHAEDAPEPEAVGFVLDFAPTAGELPGSERSPYAGPATAPVARGPPVAALVQTKLTVSSPGDSLEREADELALRVVHGAPARRHAERPAAPARGPPAATPGLPRSVASVVTAPGGGRPLDQALRERIEPHLGIDLGHVRVRQGPDAAAAAHDLRARAFTSGSTIFLGAGASPADVSLMAHEATHVAQQQTVAAARTTLMRDATDLLPDISLDDVIPDWILDGVRSTVRAIPGYILLTYIAGRDPLSDEPAPASPQEVVEALLTRGPFGAAVGAVLETLDVLGQVFDFVMEGLAASDLTLARLQRDIDSAWSELSVTNGIAGNAAIVERYVAALLRDVTAFVESIVDRVLEVVRSVVATVAEPLLDTPVWHLAKKVLHHDPLLGVPVEAPTAEIIADFLRLIGEEQRLAQMEERGTLQATADWLDTQLATFASLATELGTLFTDAWAAIQPENLPNLLTDLEALATRAISFVARVGEFAATVISKILELVKDALLEWLSETAESVPGFPLLTVILGVNPFTGAVVPRTAENLIKGFITLLPGGAETYDQLAESGVIGSAAAQIEGAMERLGISLEMVTGLFRGIWDTLTLDDLLDPLGAFARVLALFGEPLARLVEFVAVVVEVVVTLILRLMNFPTELLASVIANTVAAITDIKRDPVGFLRNMVEAIKLGFTGFFDNIARYLLDGLVAWLFRGLGQLGIALPTDFTLASILQLVFSVLGLTVEHLWTKLGEHIGPERVAAIRGAIDRLTGAWAFIQEVQRDGLAAIWRYVKDQLSGIWTTLLSMATEWIIKTVVVSATVKLLSFIDPSGIMAVINTCIAVFNAVMSAIEYLRDMLEVFNAYVSTLAAVAAGNIVPGAQMLEAGLASIIPIAIGFLAKQVGIGNVPDKIAELIGSLRELIDEALDWLISGALRIGRAALDALGLGAGSAAPADAPAAAAGAVEQPFTFGTEQHEIKARPDGDRMRITIASNGDMPFWDKVHLLETNVVRFWKRDADPDVRARGVALEGRIRGLEQLEQTWQAAFAAAAPDDRFRVEQDGTTALRVELSAIATAFQLNGMNLFYEPPAHRFQDYPPDGWGRGLRAEGVPISSASRGMGTPATGAYIPGIDLRPNQERGHLVANLLGGLGDDRKHLTPIGVPTNTAMRVGPEAAAGRFIYQSDPANTMHYITQVRYRDVGAFQTWLAQALAPLVIPPNAGDRLWRWLMTANPTPGQVDAAVGFPMTGAQYGRIMDGLAYYFLSYQIDVAFTNINPGPGNMQPIPNAGPAIVHPVPVP